MKKIFTPLRIIAGAGLLVTVFAIYSFTKTDDDKKRKKTEKRIEIVEENGEKKVTVTTITDGKKEVKTYTGDEAEKFLEKEHDANGNFHMSFDFDIDTMLGRNSFDISIDGFGAEFKAEMEKMLKELEQSGTRLEFDLEKMLKSIDSSFSGNNFKMYSFNHGLLDSAFNGNFNFDIDVDINDDSKGSNHSKRRIIVSHSVVMEDIDKKKGTEKDIHISDLSFYPNPSAGNFTLRYKSESLDMIDIKVTDLNGKSVYNERVSATGTVIRNIELNEPSGTYILTLQQGKKQVSKKLVIQ